MNATAMQRLVDRNDITDLVYRLALALDEGRFDDMADLLLNDATARTPGGIAEGRDAVVAQARRNHQPGTGIQHVTSDVLIDIDGEGDRAQVRSNLNVTFAVPVPAGPAASAPPVQYALGAVYRFTVVRTPTGWRFATVEAIPVWATGDRPVPAPASAAAPA